jgi:membrane fusion protein, multidrug efflux system
MPPAGGPALAALAMLALLAGCGRSEEPPAPEIRPVRVVTIEERPGGDTVSLTGTVQAEATVDLAFRINGRMTKRLVNVGDTVAPGQLVARLDPENEENALRAARADLAAAMGQLTEAQNNYNRQSTLLRDGWTTKVRYDEARQTVGTTQSRADAAQAQLNIAEN